MKILMTMICLAAVVACNSAKKKDAPTTEKAAVTDAAKKAKEEKAKTKSGETAGSVTCVLDKDSREIKVVRNGTGCEVQYTKLGQTNSIANSANGVAHCEKVLEKIKGNLSGSGYKCE